MSCVGSNAADIMYNPDKLNSKFLSVNEVYVVTSGGIYYDGTTFISRTVHFKKPT